MRTGRTGLREPLSRPGDGGRDLVHADPGRGDEDDDDRVDDRIGEQERERQSVELGGRGSEHVDRVGAAGLGREDRGEARARLLRELRELEPGGVARVGAEDPETTGVRQHGDAPSGRRRLGREERRDVDELLEGRRADDAGLAEQRRDGSVGARERRRVRACSTRSCAGDAALHREDRLRARDAPRDPPEAPRVAERLDVEEDEGGRRVVLPVLEQVVRGDVRLVPDGDERGEAEPSRARLLEEGEPERTALGREADRPGREGMRREGRVETGGRARDPEAVRTDQARAVRPDERQQAVLERRPLPSRARRSRPR